MLIARYRTKHSGGYKGWGGMLCLILLLASTGCAPHYVQQIEENLNLADYNTVYVTFLDETAKPYGRGKVTPGELEDFGRVTAEKLSDLSLFQSVKTVPSFSDLGIICEIKKLATSYRTFRFWVGLGPGKGAITFTTHFVDMHTGEAIARFQKQTEVPDPYRTVEGLIKVMIQAVSDDITAFVVRHS